MATHFDCLIIGAGISGLDAAYHVQTHCKWATYCILERRANLGGTWDFFKYPGIRSDSDMHTFGFSWKIWKSAQPIATAEEIMAYLKEAAEEQGIMEKIKFNCNIETAEWSSSDNLWYLETSNKVKYTCSMLFGCTGYFSYENPYEPRFPGHDDFKGPIVHPQKWNAQCDEMIKGKKVAMIGSGATAVTILPSIAESAEHVTMVQRTPTYIAARPVIDPVADFFKRWLPESIAVRINRYKAVILGALFYQYCSRYPESAKKYVRKMMFKEVKSVMSEEEFNKHFTPPYNPWEQRFCLAPGGDFYQSLRAGKASIVTGHIDKLTEQGILMKDGTLVEADFIISSTGLTMQQNFPFSTIKAKIDGKEYKAADHCIYNGIMIDDVPNMAFIVGYTNASWTLKADIASIYFTQLLNHMRSNNIEKVVPKLGDDVNYVYFTGGLSSGYFSRSKEVLPRQGDKYPWNTGVQDYITDLLRLTFRGFCRESLEFFKNDKKFQ